MTPADDDLEARVDRALRRLPSPRAPHTLLPRVMTSVHAWRERPWYTRAWFAWPLGWRLLSIVPAALLMYFVWHLPAPPAQVVAATSASRVVWDLMIAPLLPYFLVLVVLMGLACVLFGLALNYVLLERAEQR
jgi:Na+/proline symporter